MSERPNDDDDTREATAPEAVAQDASAPEEGGPDEGAPDDGATDDGELNDTVPEVPSSEAPSREPPAELEGSAEEGGATHDVEPRPLLQETPERAGRRVERAGMRVGTRVALGLVVASVLPSALATAGVLLVETPSALDPVHLRVVVGALASAVVLSLLVGLGVRRDLTRGFAALDARLRLLATGQASERTAEKRPGELHLLEDAVDALSGTLGALRARDQADRERSERVFTLAERVDEIARGQLGARLPSSDDVAEASLAAAVNRLVDAFERRVVRLKSHAALLATSDGAEALPRASDDGGDDDDPLSLVEKRVAGLKPIPPLLQDIAGRLATLSRRAQADARLSDDLARLSEAIAQRARAAQALFDSLEAQLPRLLRDGDGDGSPGLTADQRRALAMLARDLEELTVDASLPRLVESLPDLGAGGVAGRLSGARRLARAKADA